jgi:hypothetical protein
MSRDRSIGKAIGSNLLAYAKSPLSRRMRMAIRRAAKELLPKRTAEWYRRRRINSRYLKSLGWELLQRKIPMDALEGLATAPRSGLYEWVLREVLQQTDAILQQLDRRVEGTSARLDDKLVNVEEQLAQFRSEIQGGR